MIRRTRQFYFIVLVDKKN